MPLRLANANARMRGLARRSRWRFHTESMHLRRAVAILGLVAKPLSGDRYLGTKRDDIIQRLGSFCSETPPPKSRLFPYRSKSRSPIPFLVNLYPSLAAHYHHRPNIAILFCFCGNNFLSSGHSRTSILTPQNPSSRIFLASSTAPHTLTLSALRARVDPTRCHRIAPEESS